jgi:hypothetical protein
MDETDSWLLNLPPTSKERWAALAVAAGILAGFGIVAPFALCHASLHLSHPLPPQYQLLTLLPTEKICCQDFFRKGHNLRQPLGISSYLSHFFVLLPLPCSGPVDVRF